MKSILKQESYMFKSYSKYSFYYAHKQQTLRLILNYILWILYLAWYINYFRAVYFVIQNCIIFFKYEKRKIRFYEGLKLILKSKWWSEKGKLCKNAIYNNRNQRNRKHPIKSMRLNIMTHTCEKVLVRKLKMCESFINVT